AIAALHVGHAGAVPSGTFVSRRTQRDRIDRPRARHVWTRADVLLFAAVDVGILVRPHRHVVRGSADRRLFRAARRQFLRRTTSRIRRNVGTRLSLLALGYSGALLSMSLVRRRQSPTKRPGFAAVSLAPCCHTSSFSTKWTSRCGPCSCATSRASPRT